MKRTLSFADMAILNKKIEKKVRKTQSCAAKFGSGMNDHHAILDVGIDDFDACIDIESYDPPDCAMKISAQRFTTKDLSDMLSMMKTHDSSTAPMQLSSQLCFKVSNGVAN
jgi:hypothetical protein